MIAKISRDSVASCSSLVDSDSYSSSFKLNKHRQIRDLRIPGLMFLLVLCDRRFSLFKPELESRNGREGGDMLDTLINEELFSKDGRESGVMLDTLIGEGMFCLAGPVDMSDTLNTRVSPPCLPFVSVISNFGIEHSRIKSSKPILRKYIKVLTVAILGQSVGRSTIVNRSDWSST